MKLLVSNVGSTSLKFKLFDMPEGQELLKKWGLPATLRGVGHCVLGYADGPAPAPKPRKEGYIIRP